MLEQRAGCSGGPEKAPQGLCRAASQSERGVSGGVQPQLGYRLEKGSSSQWPPLCAWKLGGGIRTGLTPRSALQRRGGHGGGCHPHPVLLEALLSPDCLPEPLQEQVGGGHHRCHMADVLSEDPSQEGPAGSACQTTGEPPQQSPGDGAYTQHVHSISILLCLT